MKTEDLSAGQIVDQTILDANGKALFEKGSFLDDFQIEGLLRDGITEIYVQEDTEEGKEKSEVVIAKDVQETIERVREEDRSGLNLSENVRKRVNKGIQYLFSNEDNENFANETSNITEELMKALSNNNTIAIDVGTLKVSDEYTFKHSVDVATMSMVIAKRYGLDDKSVRDVGIAGLLHDVGKIKIPTEILNKPSRLTESEFEFMKQHARFGYEMLKEKGAFDHSILMGVLQHHEKLNGGGYPNGLKDADINLYAKIIAVADIYDSLVTKRSYKKGFSKRDAIEIIMAMTSELDIFVMQSFFDSVILYPVDSIVRLSNGEDAKVVKNNPGFMLRPNVVGVKSGKLYRLAEDIACASIVIL
ncbi:MAG: HD-GYP domain-containing protein [Lachnospiraceae bacterium]|nr:HD-GYP domain-containing protein [Lachnospiraceae bacterium]